MQGIVPSGFHSVASAPWTFSSRRGMPAAAVAALLAALTLAAFSGALDGAFLSFDDKQYVVDNPVVRAGVTAGGVELALTRSYASNWHPLTWLSLMLDVEIFGLDPRGFHATNILLHAANAVLLFLLVRALTGAFWRSAAVAALFAVHPLRAESVAWIVERKDVLSGFFGLLALHAYVRHARRPGMLPYLSATLFLALGLMAKPVLVSWPLLMLVLDGWPLGRLSSRAAAGRLLLEKAPWFALAAAASFLAFVAQSKGGAVLPADEPFGARILNVFWAYAAYLGKALWPSGLAAFYPFENRSLLSLPVLGAILLIAVLTWVAAAQASRRPWIAAGWCWYLISLVPMIGLVRVGGQAIADRYTYIPLIGPVIAAVWLLAAWARGTLGRRAVTALLVAAVLALAALTRIQTGYWLTDRALFSRMVQVVPGNFVGLYGLGLVHHERGEVAEAERCYLRSIASNGRYYQSRIKLARLYLDNGRTAEAEEAFRRALALDAGDAMAQSVFGLMLQRGGKLEEAAEHLAAAVELQPGVAAAHNNLGVVLGQLSRTGEAVESFRRAIAIDPGFAEARANLEALLGVAGGSAPAPRGPR